MLAHACVRGLQAAPNLLGQEYPAMTRSTRSCCSQRSLETLVRMGERLGVTPASPLKHSESTKLASLQELESHVGHILPLDQAQAQMDDRHGAPSASYSAGTVARLQPGLPAPPS